MTSLFAADFLDGASIEDVPTHDTLEFIENRRVEGALDPGERERLRQLRELGYIGNGK